MKLKTEISPQEFSLDHEWERTFDAVPDLILILDVHHRVVRANRAIAERLGLPPEELRGMTCYEVVHGTDAPPMFCPHSELLCDGREHSTEVEDERLGGTFLVSVSPLLDPEGNPIGSVHVARDISQQKRAEAEARKAVNQREQFLAVLSHELRNPLGAILNAAYVVKNLPSGESSFNDALVVIERQAQQMSCLLDDLLDVSRVMQGKIEIRQEKVDIVETLASAIKVAQPAYDKREQQLVLQIDSGRLLVQGDGSRLQQVAVNLLTNACKYTPSHGRIMLSAQAEGDDAVIRVRDTGRGIPPDKLESIFDLFVQTDDSLHRDYGGMGIGLTLVRMLVEMHGGQVTAHSDGTDRGSEFVVRLPLLVDQDERDESPRNSPPTSAAARILIVEDNADSRMMLQALLKIDGHQVQVAEDGTQGLATLEHGDFDIALIDIGLPGLSGYEVARQFRSRQRERDVRLVALTGYGRPSDRQAVLDAGFDEHLVKPCDPEDLQRVLQAVQPMATGPTIA